MSRISSGRYGQTTFQRLLGHNKPILEAWDHLEETFIEKGVLSANLKEQVRRVLAFGNGCEYCQAFGHPDAEHVDPKESLAVAFAEQMLEAPQEITDGQIEVLRSEFTDAEVSELVAWITFITANQTFGAVLRPDLQPDQVSG